MSCSFVGGQPADMATLAADLDGTNLPGMVPDSWPLLPVTGGATVCDPSWDGRWAMQPHAKIYAIRSGFCRYDAGAGWQELGSGHVHLIPGGRRHRYACPRRMVVDWVHLDPMAPDAVRLLAALPGVRSWPAAETSAWLARAAGACAGHDPAARWGILGLVCDLLGRLAGQDAPAVADPRLARAHDLIAHQMRTKSVPTVEEVLSAARAAAGMHDIHFRRRYVATYGRTPRAHAVAVRLERGLRALADPEHSVAAAAAAAGYADPFHFSRAFRQRYGQSPRAWRQRPRGP